MELSTLYFRLSCSIAQSKSKVEVLFRKSGLLICLVLSKYFSGDQVKKSEMS